jgi:glycosyltransferase involved in cell wall biosynthesis
MAKLITVDPEYKLTIIGTFCDELYEEYYFDQVKKLKLENNIKFLGKMAQPQLVTYLQNTDFFIITSIIEGLSQASLEAMACGAIPVIADYFGAEEAYPKKYLYCTVDEAIDKILNPAGTRVDSRKIIDEKYLLSDNVNKVKELIGEIRLS